MSLHVHLLVNCHFRYEKAAKLYAQTEASFEEVALKFMEIKQEDALQAFLLEVLTFYITSLSLIYWRYKFKKTESFATERRSTDATFHAGPVVVGTDVAQVGVAQGRWNSD